MGGVKPEVVLPRREVAGSVKGSRKIMMVETCTGGLQRGPRRQCSDCSHSLS